MKNEFISLRLDHDHFYPSRKNPDVLYPSVTTVLGDSWAKGPEILKWVGKHGSYENAMREMDEKAKRGTAIHNLIESMAKGERYEYQRHGSGHPIPDDHWRILDSFCQWSEDYNPQLVKLPKPIHVFRHGEEEIVEIGSEVPVVSDEHGYGGTTDFVCIVDGLEGPGVVDFKTTESGIWDSQIIQSNAYIPAIKETTGIDCKWSSILRLGTTHKCGYEFKVSPWDEEMFQLFMYTKAIYHWKNPKAAPRFRQVRRFLHFGKSPEKKRVK